MIGQFIQLSQVLEEIERKDDQGIPVQFQMKFVTADRRRGTGGEIIEINGARNNSPQAKGKIIPVKGGPSSSVLKGSNPHHWSNSTRNFLLPNGAIRKVHIRLIIQFNHKKVVF